MISSIACYGAAMMLLLLASCSDNALSKLNTAPVAQILSSSDVLTPTAGTAWTLRGSASDADDDAASLLASWRLNDAEVCAGAAPGADGTTTCAVDAPVGTAVIQLEVQDPSGATGVDDLVIEVSPNTAPTASISAPGEGEQLESGNSSASSETPRMLSPRCWSPGPTA